jgi:hypothetical protein
MANVIVFENGEKVVRPEEPGDRPAPPTAEELDALAALVADQFLENDKKMKALGLVIADLVEAQFGLTQAQARQEVRDRFLAYYRTLLG